MNSNKDLTALAQTLRKNMTREEKHLWYDFLKKQPLTINRQKVLGKYIVDFLCEDAKLVIELDGAQHYSEQGRLRDAERDAYLNKLGYSVVRYTDHDIRTNFDAVCLDIERHLNERRF